MDTRNVSARGYRLFLDDESGNTVPGPLSPNCLIRALGSGGSVQGSNVTLDDSDNIRLPGDLTLTGGGTIGTTSNGDLTLNPSGTGDVNIAADLNITLAADESVTIDARTDPQAVTTGAMVFQYTPTLPGGRCITFDIDAGSQADTMGISVEYTATGMSAGKVGMPFDITIDTANASGGSMNALNVDKVGLGTLAVNAVHVGVGISPVHQESGTFGNLESAMTTTDEAAFVDVTAACNDTGVDVELFSANNDFLYIGMAAMYSEIEVLLDTVASGAGIKPEFYYSTGAGAWTQFGPSDQTNGFRTNGAIEWEADDLAGWVIATYNAVADKYWIKIKRTQVALTTPPVEDRLQASSPTQFIWDDQGDVNLNNLALAGDLELTAGGSIATTSDGNITFTPHGIGRVFSDAILDMNGNAIIDVGTVDGVDISAHAADTSDPHGASMSISTQLTTPKIVPPGGVLLLDAGGSGVHIDDELGVGIAPTLGLLHLDEDKTDTVNALKYSFRHLCELNPAAQSASKFRGWSLQMDIKAGCAQVFTGTSIAADFQFHHDGSGNVTGGMRGLNGAVRNNSGATVDIAYGDWMSVVNDDGIITEAIGARFGVNNADAGGEIGAGTALYATVQNSNTLGTAIGLRIPTIEGTTTWGVYVDAVVQNYMAGDLKIDGDVGGLAGANTYTGATDTPTWPYNWDGTGGLPNGYIKAYVGVQAVVIPYWNT